MPVKDRFDRYEKAIPKKFTAIAMSFDRVVAIEIRKSNLKRYTVVLATNNPAVDLHDEICYLLNQINLGKKPPADETFLMIDKPKGWKKLKGYWVKDRRELGRMLKKFKAGQTDMRAWAKKWRGKKKKK